MLVKLRVESNMSYGCDDWPLNAKPAENYYPWYVITYTNYHANLCIYGITSVYSMPEAVLRRPPRG